MSVRIDLILEAAPHVLHPGIVSSTVLSAARAGEQTEKKNTNIKHINIDFFITLPPVFKQHSGYNAFQGAFRIFPNACCAAPVADAF